nr:hypothetical protein [Mesorhizobium sp. B2-3-5]
MGWVRHRSKVFPRDHCKPLVFGETCAAEYVGVGDRSAGKRVEIAFRLTLEQVACERNWIGPHHVRCGQVYLAGTEMQSTKNAIGIVDRPGSLFNAIHRMLDKPECDFRARSGRKIGNRIERCIYPCLPARSLPVIDIGPGARCRPDRFPQTRFQRLVVGLRESRVHIQLAQQLRIVFRQFEDHVHQPVDTLAFQIFPYSRRCIGRFGFSAGAAVVRGERRRNHMLAKTQILESGAGTFAIDRRSAPGDDRMIVLRAGNLRDDAPGGERNNFDASVTAIVFAARECLSTSQFSQPIGIKPKPRFCCHACDLDPIARSGTSHAPPGANRAPRSAPSPGNHGFLRHAG